MVFFKGIREKIGQMILRKKLRMRKRSKRICNFDTAQNIGVIFKTDSQSDFELVKHFLQFLSDHNNKVFALCFVDSKKVPDFYLLRKGFNFFSRAELSFFFIPKSQTIINFTEQNFDMLIDLSVDESFPVHYISAVSNAKLKLGKQKNSAEHIDIMIDVTKNNSVSQLIEGIKQYVPVLCQ